MRALFYVEPLVLHNRPFHYWAWLGNFAEMAHAIRAAGWEVRIVVNEALALRATAPRGPAPSPPRRGHGLSPDEVVVLAQEPIRRRFDAPNRAILQALHRGGAPAAVAAYADLVRAALGDFVPDVMLALTPAEQLRVAFPGALLLASETAAYSRAPFATHFFFDPEGLWDRSIPARHAAALLERAPAPGARALLDQFRARFGAYFRAVTPFAPLEAELRRRHRRIGLLPLQFGNEPGFDCNAPFDNQGEYLFHVLENLPADVGLIAVEHPTAHWVGDVIDAETRELLAVRWPNLRFVAFGELPSAGQVLIQHVDFVVSVSSSLGQQAALLGKPLVAVGTSHLAALATVRGMEHFPDALPAPDPRLDAVLGWLMRHYFVPRELCQRPDWMAAFLERGVARHRAGRLGPGFFDPTASDDELAACLFRTLDEMGAAALRGRVANGDFAAWSRGEGPFWVGDEGPDGWHLLDYGGGVATLGRSGGAASVQRHKVGAGPTYLLQRIPDAASCAGALVRLRFRARSAERAPLAAYLYVQLDDGQPGLGTPPRTFALEPEWRALEHVAPVPALAGRAPGPGSHVEVVFALRPEAGTTSFQLTDVALEAAAF